MLGIGFAELVGVHLSRFQNDDYDSGVIVIGTNGDATRGLLQTGSSCVLSPHSQLVLHWRNLMDLNRFLACDGIVRRRYRDDNRSHILMDVAEDVGDSFSHEGEGMRTTRLIETEIKTAAIEERKHIMEERITIGEGNDASRGNN